MKIKTSVSFDAAHRLVGHDGACQRLHGHRWVVDIEVHGEVLDEVGMLVDFGKLKNCINAMFDHRALLKRCKENEILIAAIESTCGVSSVCHLKENPTAEHLAFVIKNHLKGLSFKGEEYKIRVWESEKSYAEV